MEIHDAANDYSGTSNILRELNYLASAQKSRTVSERPQLLHLQTLWQQLFACVWRRQPDWVRKRALPAPPMTLKWFNAALNSCGEGLNSSKRTCQLSRHLIMVRKGKRIKVQKPPPKRYHRDASTTSQATKILNNRKSIELRRAR